MHRVSHRDAHATPAILKAEKYRRDSTPRVRRSQGPGEPTTARLLEHGAEEVMNLDLEALVHAILTCVTAGPGLGFNRAALFLAAPDQRHLDATMAIGPATPEEARTTWTRLAHEQKTLDELLRPPAAGGSRGAFERLVEGLSIPLPPLDTQPDVGDPLSRAFHGRRVVKVKDAFELALLPEPLRRVFDGSEVVCVPLVAKDRSLGMIVADNAFTGEPIDAQRTGLLQLLALLAGLALDNARMYGEVQRQAAQLARALDDLHAAQERLIHNERLATVGAVVARVSHEVRNPLTTIGGFARGLLSRPADPERVARNASIIVDEVSKLELLLKEMLDFTSPRAPRLETLDLNRLITAFLQLHAADLEGRPVKVTMTLAPHLPAIPADATQIQRVLQNLWQNALQALEDPGRLGGHIQVSTSATAHDVVFEVRDDGPGIPADVRSHLFTPFFTTKQRGSGLGLAVVKKIVDDHQGSIEILSPATGGSAVAAPTGTAFRISLPRMTPKEEPTCPTS